MTRNDRRFTDDHLVLVTRLTNVGFCVLAAFIAFSSVRQREDPRIAGQDRDD